MWGGKFGMKAGHEGCVAYTIKVITCQKKLQVQLASYKATITSKQEGEFILESYGACMVESPLYVAMCTLYIYHVCKLQWSKFAWGYKLWLFANCVELNLNLLNAHFLLLSY